MQITTAPAVSPHLAAELQGEAIDPDRLRGAALEATQVDSRVLFSRSGMNNCRMPTLPALVYQAWSSALMVWPWARRSRRWFLRSWVRTQYGDPGHFIRT